MSKKRKITTYSLDPLVAQIIKEFAHLHRNPTKTQSSVIEDLVKQRARRFLLDDRPRYHRLRELSEKLLTPPQSKTED